MGGLCKPQVSVNNWTAGLKDIWWGLETLHPKLKDDLQNRNPGAPHDLLLGEGGSRQPGLIGQMTLAFASFEPLKKGLYHNQALRLFLQLE
jgi:hypothetical protein